MIDAKRLRSLGNDLTRIAGELASFRGAFESAELSMLPVSDMRAAILARRLRGRMFPHGLFADPAWDMLLALAVRQTEGRDMSIAALCDESAVASTTGTRWVAILEAKGLIERESDVGDKRRVNLRLTERGRSDMAAYFAAVRECEFAIA